MKQIQGDLKNIKKHRIEELGKIYDISVPVGQISTQELNAAMLEHTDALGREVAVYLSRSGKVLAVSLGDTATVSLPAARERVGFLSGVRCIHTHPTGDTRLSAPDISSLRRMKFDAMVAIARREGEHYASFACLTGDLSEDGTPEIFLSAELSEKTVNGVRMLPLLHGIQRNASKNRTSLTEDSSEKAVLVGVARTKINNQIRKDWTAKESLEELARLADTAGAEVVQTFLQKRDMPDSAYYIGKGKIEEIGMELQNLDADLLLVDDEISPAQQRNLEQAFGVKVIDRTALILDVFAQRARTREGKLQVELAQLKYRLPRLSGAGLALSRLGGGIGTRGPGETKLEVDRRRIRDRIHELEGQLSAVQKQRKLQRSQRQKGNTPTVALVGYTNAGKSSLLNVLTGAEVYAKDQLFATLDPTTRRLELPEGRAVLLTDTVGFIQKLPHSLIASFRATLEEVQEADLLLHVVDVSSAHYEQQISAVVEVLKELGVAEKPIFYVFNKMDAVEQLNEIEEKILQHRDGILLSVRTGEHLDELKEKIAMAFCQREEVVSLNIPFSDGARLEQLHRYGRVLETEYHEHGTCVTVRLEKKYVAAFERYRIKGVE